LRPGDTPRWLRSTELIYRVGEKCMERRRSGVFYSFSVEEFVNDIPPIFRQFVHKCRCRRDGGGLILGLRFAWIDSARAK
jgi:hypothetical protein